MKLGYDASILHKGSMRNTMQFLAFSSKLALSLLDQNNKPVYPYGLLASSFLNDIHSFIATYNYNEECKNFDNEV
jgi:ubiquitin conjugation factor E4 B